MKKSTLYLLILCGVLLLSSLISGYIVMRQIEKSRNQVSTKSIDDVLQMGSYTETKASFQRDLFLLPETL